MACAVRELNDAFFFMLLPRCVSSKEEEKVDDGRKRRGVKKFHVFLVRGVKRVNDVLSSFFPSIDRHFFFYLFFLGWHKKPRVITVYHFTTSEEECESLMDGGA